MAGIGVKLTNIYKKNTLTTDIIGVGYSTVVTIAPMLVVIGALVLMEYFLDFSSVAYITRELFGNTGRKRQSRFLKIWEYGFMCIR